MYLVDTSVWIDFLKGRDVPHVRFLNDLLTNPLAFGISDAIYLEILQGARNQASLDKLRRYFSQQRFYRFEDPEHSHVSTAELYLRCRNQGITIRSTLDCLVAQCAIEHELVLLHNDRDYLNMASVCGELRQKSFLES